MKPTFFKKNPNGKRDEIWKKWNVPKNTSNRVAAFYNNTHLGDETLLRLKSKYNKKTQYKAEGI